MSLKPLVGMKIQDLKKASKEEVPGKYFMFSSPSVSGGGLVSTLSGHCDFRSCDFIELSVKVG